MPTVKPLSEESRCDALIAKLYGVSAVVRLGQKGRRTPNTEGVPDRLYFCKDHLIFFEVKSASDYLSVPQISFLLNVLIRHGVAGCGNRDDLAALLNAPDQWRTGHMQIEKYKTRRKALRGA